jgi:transcriptional regulator with XRE-family HTH domain
MGYDSYKIGQRVYAARMHAGMKQSSICKLAKISQSTLSDIENGKTNLTVETLYKIADALEISVVWLLGENAEKQDEGYTQEELVDIQKYKEYIVNKRSKK